MKIDETQLKQIGTWIVLVIGAFGTPFLEWIRTLNISITWITFLITTWYAIDYILAALIYHYFKIKKNNLSWKIKSLYISVGIGFLVIIGAFGPVITEIFFMLGFSLIWTIFLGIFYYTTEGLITGLIIHHFKVPSEDVPEAKIILTEVETKGYVETVSNETNESNPTG